MHSWYLAVPIHRTLKQLRKHAHPQGWGMGFICEFIIWIKFWLPAFRMGLMQQATHPMWYYVRGRLRKQAAFTHSIENSVILDGSRHICTNWMSYTHLYVLKTTYSWDETFENDDNLKKSENEFFCGKDSQGTATVSETEGCNFIRVPQGWTPILKYITIVR